MCSIPFTAHKHEFFLLLIFEREKNYCRIYSLWAGIIGKRQQPQKTLIFSDTLDNYFVLTSSFVYLSGPPIYPLVGSVLESIDCRWEGWLQFDKSTNPQLIHICYSLSRVLRKLGVGGYWHLLIVSKRLITVWQVNQPTVKIYLLHSIPCSTTTRCWRVVNKRNGIYWL